MHTASLAVPLESSFTALSTKCQLTSRDVNGKGKTGTPLVLRWSSGGEAAMLTDTPEKPQPFSFGQYRRKLPSERRRDSKRAISKQEPVQIQEDKQEN